MLLNITLVWPIGYFFLLKVSSPSSESTLKQRGAFAASQIWPPKQLLSFTSNLAFALQLVLVAAFSTGRITINNYDTVFVRLGSKLLQQLVKNWDSSLLSLFHLKVLLYFFYNASTKMLKLSRIWWKPGSFCNCGRNVGDRDGTGQASCCLSLRGESCKLERMSQVSNYASASLPLLLLLLSASDSVP